MSTMPTLALLLLFSPAAAFAQESSLPSDPKAEAYYYFCLARMNEMEMKAAEAIRNYEKAAELDPEAAYPHVALASLYLRTRQSEPALASAKKAVELDPEVAAAQRVLGTLYFSMLRNGGGPDLAPLAIEAFSATVRLEPGDVDSRSNLARLLLASRQPAEAAVHLAEIVRYDPSAYYEMFLLAQVRRGEGETEEAIELLKQSLLVEPRQAEATELLVQLLEAERRYAEIAEVYREIVDVQPGDFDSRVRLADALAKDGRFEDAAVEFEGALEEDPSNVAVLVGLGLVRRELVQLDKAQELFERAVVADSSNVLARYSLAGVYEQKREFDNAVKEWRTLVALPDDSPRAASRRAEYWAHIGFAQEQLGSSDEAVAAYAKADELEDDGQRFRILYIQGLISADRHEEARKAVDETLSEDPDNPRLKALKTRVLEAGGDHEGALAMALKLTEEFPEDNVFAQSVVDLYQNQNRFAEAETFLRARLERSPEDVALRFQLGAMLERQKKFDEAEREFDAVLANNPDSAAALNYLGYMLADQNLRLEESLSLIQRALSQDPYNGAYLDSIGWVYFKMGELELAEDHLLRAIDSMRLNGVVYDHLGDVYLEKGNAERAVEYWRKALDQDDDEVDRDEVAAKIERAISGQ